MCFRIFKVSTNGLKFCRRLLKRLQQGSDLENNGGMCAITSSTAQKKTIVHPTSSNPWCWQPWGCTVGNHVFSTALPMGKRNSGVVIFSDCQEETRYWKQIDKKNDKQKQKTKITNGKSWGLEITTATLWKELPKPGLFRNCPRRDILLWCVVPFLFFPLFFSDVFSGFVLSPLLFCFFGAHQLVIVSIVLNIFERLLKVWCSSSVLPRGLAVHLYINWSSKVKQIQMCMIWTVNNQ